MYFLSYQRISKRAIWTSFSKQLDPMGPIANWVQLLLEGGLYQNFEETYSHL